MNMGVDHASFFLDAFDPVVKSRFVVYMPAHGGPAGNKKKGAIRAPF